MIEYVRMRGIQAYEDATFQLTPGLNAVVGENDVGKSAVVRALCCVVYNEPMQIRSGCEEGEIEIGFSDLVVSKLRRVRKGKLIEQIYRTRATGGQWVKWEAGRHGLPEPLVDLFRMAPVAVDKERLHLNVARQFDPPFLISHSFSSSYRAKVLGSMSAQGSFDAAVKQVQVQQKRLASEQKVVASLLIESEETERGIGERLRRLEEAHAKAEHLESIYTQHTTDLDRLVGLRNEYGRRREEQRDLQGRLSRYPDMSQTREWMDALQRDAIRAARLAELRSQYDRGRSTMDRLAGDLERLAGVLAMDEKVRRLEHGRRLSDLAAHYHGRSHEVLDLQARVRDLTEATGNLHRLLSMARELDRSAADRRLLLHRYRDTKSQSFILRSAIADVTKEIEEALRTKKTLVAAIHTCPFWDQIEFQPDCRKRYEEV